jgi:hypothetical protein
VKAKPRHHGLANRALAVRRRSRKGGIVAVERMVEAHTDTPQEWMPVGRAWAKGGREIRAVLEVLKRYVA